MLKDMYENLCDAERERLAAVEICIDEALTIFDRHIIDQSEPAYMALAALSRDFHEAMTKADGYSVRLFRMRRVRDRLTQAFPMSDEDFGRHDAGDR